MSVTRMPDNACHVQDYDMGSLYGLEKFWAYHHYGGIPKDEDVEIDAKVSTFNRLVFTACEALHSDE